MKIFILIKTDATDEQWKEVRAFSTMEGALEAAKGDGFQTDDIELLKKGGALAWTSEEFEGEDFLNMSLEIYETELK